MMDTQSKFTNTFLCFAVPTTIATAAPVPSAIATAAPVLTTIATAVSTSTTITTAAPTPTTITTAVQVFAGVTVTLLLMFIAFVAGIVGLLWIKRWQRRKKAADENLTLAILSRYYNKMHSPHFSV